MEDLMKPRYKVIADYPNASFKVGSIWEESEAAHFAMSNDETEFTKYPHLFRPMHWSEERNIEDMPKYVKATRWKAIYKVKEYVIGSNLVEVEGGEIPLYLPDLLPSTEEEYNNQQK